MKNNYEVPEAFELGRVRSFIMGQKVPDATWEDWALGMGYRFLATDIDESDE